MASSPKIIAFQGTNGANSNLACLKFYPNFKAVAYQTFQEVFMAVQNDEVEFGMIPLENSYAGRVSEIHNLLQKHSVSIIAEHFFQISHQLCGVEGSQIQDIKEVYSHPQALMQCQNNLQKLNLNIVEYSNTAKAAEFVAKLGDKSKGAICSKLASELYGLDILQENVQDSCNDNITIFIVISKNPPEIDYNSKPALTSLLFTIRNIPGSLYKALGGFATNGVSIVKLESYIPGGVSKQAKFFITIEGHPAQNNVALALEELGFFSKNVKLLGVFYGDELRFNRENENN